MKFSKGWVKWAGVTGLIAGVTLVDGNFDGFMTSNPTFFSTAEARVGRPLTPAAHFSKPISWDSPATSMAGHCLSNLSI